jgi:nucleotide-binding universal stress UspA family protein
MFAHILVPLDGTPESDAALPLARLLASQLGSAITLVRVVKPAIDDAERQVRRDVEASLAKTASELAIDGREASALVRDGDDVAAEVLAASRAQQADLIVMRTRAQSGLTRWRLGSVTEKVVSESPVPILLLRPEVGPRARIERLLVPVDGSPGGGRAMGAALGLARATSASVRLFQVARLIEPYKYLDPYGVAYYDPAWDDDALEGARAYVTSLAERLTNAGVPTEGEAVSALDVADAIQGAAGAAGADLIVMSTSAHTGPARAILGSVADAVVRTAPCPVLLVHRQDR